MPVSELIPNPKNWRSHPPAQRKALQGLLDSVGWADAVLARETDDGLMLIDGHLRRDMAGDFEVPVLVLDVDEDEADLILATHDPIAAMAESDVDKLSELVNAIDVDDSRTGDLLAELLPKPVENELPVKGSLVEEFLVPPFSILDSRQGYWMDRKRGWQSIGIKSEIGRGEEGEFLNPNDALLFKSLSGRVPTYYTQKTKAEKKLGRKLSNKEFEEKHLVIKEGTIATKGTSIFDPVLCELVYTWFSSPDGKVLDPFAGGSVRGVIAAMLGRDYFGIELSKKQVKANQNQKHIFENADGDAQWVNGDSTNVNTLAKGKKFDFLFTCPPYGDLEVYSDDPKDLSSMDAEEFNKSFATIIKRSCKHLKDDRFACIVVGEYRSKTGGYQNFVSNTIKAFVDAGLTYYNEMILITSVGSLALRAGGQFRSGRKIGKSHQNVLVFLKGDSKKATEHLGDVEICDIQGGEE